jgi:putative molybdopterin biosynthesis protein
MVIAEPALMTPSEVAEALRVSRSKVYALVASGRLPSTRITGSVRIPRAALDQYIAAATSWPEAPVASIGR